MTTTLVTLIGDVTDAIGTDFDARRTKAYVRYNTDKVVTDGDEPIHLGGGTVNVAADGTFSLPDVVASTSLVENLQATVYIAYSDPTIKGNEARKTATFGPYDLSAETGTVDIRDLESVQALPATAISQATAALDAIVAEGQALLDAQEAISGLTGEDDAVALLITDPSDSRTAGDVRWARKTNVKVTVGKTSGYDYVTTDYASDDLALAAAVASLPTGFTSGGGWIELGPGLFDFANGVDGSATQNVRLSGCGGRTKIRWKTGNTFADTTPGVNFLYKGGYGFITHDIWWDGLSSYTCPINGVGTQVNGGSTNTLGSGILVTSGRTWIDRTYVTGMAEDGIRNDGGIGTKYGSVEIIRCGGIGLNISGTVNPTFGTYATDQDLSSVWIGACGRGLYIAAGGIGIIAAHVWGCETDGIDIDAPSVRLVGSYPEGNAGWGVVVRKSNVTVDGCEIWNNGVGATPAGGIHLASTAVTDCIITDNQLRDNRADSVLLNGARYCKVSGNVVTDSYARAANAPDTVTTRTSSGTQTTSTTFTDANAPSWMATAQAAMNTTIAITGAGTAGAVHNAQVLGWVNSTTVTLSAAQITATVNPTYVIHAVSYGIREAGSAFGNDIHHNHVHKNDAARQQVFPVAPSSGTAASRVTENRGVDSMNLYDQGSVSSGTLGVDLRIGGVYRATLTANVTTVSFFGSVHRNQEVVIQLTQDGTGGRTVTGWPANIKWADGRTPTVTATAGETWVTHLRYDGTNWIEQCRVIDPNPYTPGVVASAVTYTNNTIATVTGLSVAVPASVRVFVRAVVFYDGGQTGDAKFRIRATGATGTTGYYGITAGPAASATSTSAVSTNPVTAAAVVAGTGGIAMAVGTVGVGSMQTAVLEGYVTVSTTAGAIELEAAQNSTDATALTIYPGSSLRLTPAP